MTVRELLARTDARELAEWQAFYRLEPWGSGEDEFRAAMIASTIANGQRKKGQRAFKPKDFMRRFGPLDPGALSARIKAAFSGFRRSGG